MRQVLDRLEDSATGRLLPASFHCEVPAERLNQAGPRPPFWGTRSTSGFPWAHYDCGGSIRFTAYHHDPVQALLNRTWTPTLSVTGAEGFPEIKDAGNVLRPYTAFKLSLRLPPLVDAAPGGAGTQGSCWKITRRIRPKSPLKVSGSATGWNAPDTAPWFESRVECRLQCPLWCTLRLHRPGRHHSIDEHALRKASPRHR
jgi:hypothetical protein